MAEHEEDLNSTDKSEKSSERPFGTIVRSAEERDIESIRSILRDWVKDPTTGLIIESEVDEIIGVLNECLDGRGDDQFLVAENIEGKVVGMSRMSEPKGQIINFASTERPAELFNLYVAAGQNKGKGVGSALFDAVQNLARSQGYTEVMLNSGPRYKDSGWGFYEKAIGPPAGVMRNYYGEGYDAMVWRKEL